MTRARDVSRLITTPPSIYQTDTESSSAGYLTNSSASSTYLTQTSASTTYQGAPNRNLIINGAMQVAQRATSLSSITTSLYKTADRWGLSFPSALGTWTQSVENDGPTGSEFGKSLKMLCTTAQPTPSSGAGCILYQVIEGQNLQAVKKGTVEAKPLTLSFWVKSNVTGTYVASLLDENNSIGFPPYGTSIARTYTITASDTWEKKTLTFSAGTSGVIPNNNSYGLRLYFYLAAGSSLQSGTLNSSWASNAPGTQAVGQVNLASAVNNYWQVTGIQLEIGSAATPFDLKPFDEEFRKCQRYYQVYDKWGAFWCTSVRQAAGPITFDVPFRSAPTTSGSTTGFFRYGPGGQRNIVTSSYSDFSTVSCYAIINDDGAATPFTTNYSTIVKINQAFTAEL
jgi:hypothetical protein